MLSGHRCVWEGKSYKVDAILDRKDSDGEFSYLVRLASWIYPSPIVDAWFEPP